MSVIRFHNLGGLLAGFAVAVALLFSGCGGAETEPANPPQSEEAKQKMQDTIKEKMKSGEYGKNVTPPK